MSDPSKIEPGDTVYVRPHRTAPRLYPTFVYDHPAGGKEFVVESLPIPGNSIMDSVTLRYLTEDGADFGWHFVDPSYCELRSKGDGKFHPGVSVPFSARELRDQRFIAYCDRLMASPVPTVDGYSNGATFQAAVQLRNSALFQSLVPRLRRKDGTINPNRIRTWFMHSGMQIDPEVLKPHIEPPAEFANHRTPGGKRYMVNWPEVAKDFAAKQPSAKAEDRARQ